MWYEDFVTNYRSSSVDGLSGYYNHTSVFVETTADGQWTKPMIGTLNIVNRLVYLRQTTDGGEWPVETCQRTRVGGLLVVLAAPDGTGRQILIVHQSTANGCPKSKAIVSNHFYVTTVVGVDNDSDNDESPPFRSNFEDWATSLDDTELKRYQMAFRVGLMVVRNYYATPASQPGERTRWHQYDREARFSSTKNGWGGDRVYAGVQPIRKRYAGLALEYRDVRLRDVVTCWYDLEPDKNHERCKPATTRTVVLVTGTVPEALGPGYKVHREFVQLFVIDSRTRKILHDMLCFGLPYRNSNINLQSSSDDNDDESSLISDDLSQSLSSLDGSSPSTSTTNGRCHFASNGGANKPTTDELTLLRMRLSTNLLKSRCVTNKSIGIQPPRVPPTKHNPRQLFIGCVPLHVKYGQLKLLFEQFGEVTYVKVFEGYNKQTGAKMSHNYAFLFFKDELSVDRAIAASPVPLDANWNLNVSRPHFHTIPTGGTSGTVNNDCRVNGINRI